jgi:uncharacterized protein YukE
MLITPTKGANVANIIDSLVVALGLDASNFEVGQKKTEDGLKSIEETAENTAEELGNVELGLKKIREQADKAAKEFESSQKRAAYMVTQVRDQILGLVAAFTAGKGFSSFLSDVTQTDAVAGRLAKNIGMSADQLTAWEAIVTQTGGTAEGAAGSLQGLVSQFQQLSLTGQSAVVPYFRAVGIAIADSAGKMRPMKDILLDLADRFSVMDPARAQAFGAAMGIDYNTVNVLIKGRGAITALLAEQEKLGHANKKDTDAAIARQAAWRALIQSATDLGRKILTDLTPALEQMMSALKAFGEWAHRHPRMIEAAFAAITAAVLALSGAMIVNLAGTAIPALITAFGALGTAVTVAAGPIGVAITGLSIAGYELVKHWDAISDWWDNLWGKMSDAPKQVGNNGDISKLMGMGWTKEQATGIVANFVQESGGNPNAVGDAPKQVGNNGDISKLMGMGWTKEQATGIVANFVQESGGNPNAVGDSGSAYGLGQWHSDRQANFAKFAGHSIQTSTRDEQLAFANYELRYGTEQNAGRRLMQTATSEGAASVVSQYYERPAAKIIEIARRSGIAKMLEKGSDNLVQSANAAPVHHTSNTSNSSHTETNINGPITIQTQATDAPGIARSIGQAIEQYSFVTQGNYGLN